MVLNYNILREYHVTSSKNNSYVSLITCKEAVKYYMSWKDCVCNIFRLFLLRHESENNCFAPLQIFSRETRNISSVKRKFDLSAETTGGTSKKESFRIL